MRKLAIRSIGATVILACLATAAAQAAPAPTPPGAPGRPPAGTTQGRVSNTPPHISPNTVIVFPFENNTMVGGKELSETLEGEVKSGILRAGTYSIASFYPASPLLQRARQDQSLSRDDIDNVVDPMRGTVDPTRAAAVAQRMGGRYALLGSIEQADVDTAAHRSNVTVTVQMLDSLTGMPVKTAGVTGTFTGTASDTPHALVDAAARDAARRALTELGLASGTPVVTPPTMQGGIDTSKPAPKRRSTSYWLPLGVLLGVLVVSVK
jgi:hypothetical protein